MPKTDKTERKPKMTGNLYCRKCKRTRLAVNFYDATNLMLDTNEKMSICVDCCGDIYNYYFSLYQNVPKALELTCEDLDVRFSKKALEQTQSHIDKLISGGKSANSIFGCYKSKLMSTVKKNEGSNCFRYRDSDTEIIQELRFNIDNGNIDPDLILFWGEGFDYNSLIFLEAELGNWKQTHKCDNQAEVTLLKEICIKILAIRDTRSKNGNTSAELKELQELMKTASVDPAKANSASAGKSHDAFGVWIKDIEQFKPAEWHDKQEKYKDMDGFIPYIKDYIVRPIKNFITGSRDFHVNDNININLDDEGDSNG